MITSLKNLNPYHFPPLKIDKFEEDSYALCYESAKKVPEQTS
jgi:hypothetical protein